MLRQFLTIDKKKSTYILLISFSTLTIKSYNSLQIHQQGLACREKKNRAFSTFIPLLMSLQNLAVLIRFDA